LLSIVYGVLLFNVLLTPGARLLHSTAIEWNFRPLLLDCPKEQVDVTSGGGKGENTHA
jgi:hypothetical protein